MAESIRPHRPSFQEPAALEALAQRSDPIERLHAAHETAAALLRTGHADPALADRLIAVVDQVGLPTLADLWDGRPADTLPGALYRLYLVRELTTRHADDVAREFAAGQSDDPQAAPSPGSVRAMADAILHGAFTGDVGEALLQASHFCRVVGAGRSRLGAPHERVKRIGRVSDDLMTAAKLWAEGRLE